MKRRIANTGADATREPAAAATERSEPMTSWAAPGKDPVQRDALSTDVSQSPRMVMQRQRMASLLGGTRQQNQQARQNAIQSNKAESAEALPNRTGMPASLKAGIESLSGMDMSAVRVHRNSDKPAQLSASAYAQGNDIHLGPGQEHHLPHEAWHVVQQRQGRVRETVQMAGVGVNDEVGLEREADLMGARAALQGVGMNVVGKKQDRTPISTMTPISNGEVVFLEKPRPITTAVQRYVGVDDPASKDPIGYADATELASYLTPDGGHLTRGQVAWLKEIEAQQGGPTALLGLLQRAERASGLVFSIPEGQPNSAAVAVLSWLEKPVEENLVPADAENLPRTIEILKRNLAKLLANESINIVTRRDRLNDLLGKAEALDDPGIALQKIAIKQQIELSILEHDYEMLLTEDALDSDERGRQLYGLLGKADALDEPDNSSKKTHLKRKIESALHQISLEPQSQEQIMVTGSNSATELKRFEIKTEQLNLIIHQLKSDPRTVGSFALGGSYAAALRGTTRPPGDVDIDFLSDESYLAGRDRILAMNGAKLNKGDGAITSIIFTKELDRKSDTIKSKIKIQTRIELVNVRHKAINKNVKDGQQFEENRSPIHAGVKVPSLATMIINWMDRHIESQNATGVDRDKSKHKNDIGNIREIRERYNIQFNTIKTYMKEVKPQYQGIWDLAAPRVTVRKTPSSSSEAEKESKRA